MSSCLYSRKNIHRKKRELNSKQNGVLAVFSRDFYESTSWVCIVLQFIFIHHVQNKINSEDLKWTQLLNFEHSIKQMEVRTVFQPLSEAGNSQTEWKTTVGDSLAEIRIEINQSETCCVSREVLLVSWKRNDSLKYTKWLDH